MIELGKYPVPKERQANLRYRLKLLKLCQGNRLNQKAVLHACKVDLFFYVNTFVLQYNPKQVGGELGPFILWDFQEEALRATIERLFVQRRRILWEKSRELGATWLALILFDWMGLFHDWKKFFAVSHSEDAVDRPDDPDTLFWKVNFMHRHLPDWLSRDVSKRKLGFHYPATRSNFNGAATTERSGVGGRATALMLDEFSKHRKDREILGQTADTGPALIIGTHYGVGTAFYEISQMETTAKIVMHWSQHPEKKKGLYRYDHRTNKVEVLDKSYVYPEGFKFVMNGKPEGGPFPGLRSPWYDAECLERANTRDVAMHLDINPQGSVSQFFEPLVIRDLKVTCCVPPYWEGDVTLDRDTGRPECLSRRKGGPLKLWCHLDQRGCPPLGKYFVGSDISEGGGGSNSCLSIVDGTDGTARYGEKVVEYVNPRISVDDFALVSTALCWLFADPNGNPALLAFEMQGPGLRYWKKIEEGTRFRHVYYRRDELVEYGKITDRPGWVPDPKSKRLTLEDYRSALANGRFINRSELALDECLLFQYSPDGNRVYHSGELSQADPSGAGGNHGDRVIADALAWKLCKGRGSAVREKLRMGVPLLSLQWRRDLHGAKERDEWAEA